MKTLKLKNAKLETLTETKVSFIGELKGYIQKWSMTITDIQRFYDLQKLDKNTTYNIWYENNQYRFIAK